MCTHSADCTVGLNVSRQCYTSLPKYTHFSFKYCLSCTAQLLLIDIPSGQIFDIPTLRSNSTPTTPNTTGIHCIAVSPDGRLLATGGVCPNELALYRLPEFSPCLVGQVNAGSMLALKISLILQYHVMYLMLPTSYYL